MILSNASEDADCTDENVPGYIGEVFPQKDIQSLKEQFMAFIQLKNYTQLTVLYKTILSIIIILFLTKIKDSDIKTINTAMRND